MANQEQARPKFTIRRLTSDEVERSRQRPSSRWKQEAADSKSIATQETKKKAVDKESRRSKEKSDRLKILEVPESSHVLLSYATTGGRFRSAGAVLAFLGSALGSGMTDEATVRRTPEGSWWAEVAVPHESIASLVWISGGRPYARQHRQWVALSVSGELPAADEGREILQVNNWPVVDLGELLAQTHLMPGRYMGSPELAVIVPGVLGRWVLRRAAALGLDVTVTPSLRYPMNMDEKAGSGVLFIELKSQRRDRDIIPAALVHSLTRLPYVMATQSFADKNLLVDVRCRIPLSSNLVSGMIPAGETWVLGPPESGIWRIYPDGETVNGDALLDAPNIAIIDNSTDDTIILPEAGKPESIPVRLIPRASSGRKVDAVLLDDTELEWVRPFLVGKPIGEVSFLIPGSGAHLLTAPGGLPGGGVPFGVPLVRVGPGGLYLEMGTDFYPPLPDSARQAMFQTNRESVVAVVRDRAWRFDLNHMTPTWSLWVGEAPDVQSGLSFHGKMMLSKISNLIQKEEAKRAQPPRREYKHVNRSERVQLLKQAQKEEVRGNLVHAAELLEKAGYTGPAGRLYERAAKRL